MTSYYLSVGYSGESSYSQEENWEILKKIFIDVTKKSKLIKKEMKRHGLKTEEFFDQDNKIIHIDEYLSDLKNGDYHKFSMNEDEYPQIEFCTHFEAKLHIFRALIRIVMLEMHKMEIELNVQVL